MGIIIVGVKGDFSKIVLTTKNINIKPNIPLFKPLYKERNKEINRVEKVT
jgi:hypothetical protein